MSTLVFASDKGGVGKSTTAVNFAVMLVYREKTVILLTADKNKSCSNWSEKRKALGLPNVPVYEAFGDLTDQIKKLSKMCDVLIVDCPGHDSAEFRSAIMVADTLLTLVKPSSRFETETLTTVTEKVRKVQHSHNPELKAWVLVTRVKPNKIPDAIELEKELLSDEVWIKPLRTRISELDVFENACNEGAGVHDIERASSLGKAKGQLELIANELGLM